MKTGKNRKKIKLYVLLLLNTIDTITYLPNEVLKH